MIRNSNLQMKIGKEIMQEIPTSPDSGLSTKLTNMRIVHLSFHEVNILFLDYSLFSLHKQ